MKVIDKSTGKIYDSIAQAYRNGCYHEHVRTIQKKIKKNGHYDSIYPYISGNMETESTSAKNAPVHRIHEVYTEEELDNLVALKEKAQDIELFTITPRENTKTKRVAISLLSDVHADEVVRKESCAGLNSYDQKIAKTRISNYFEGLVRMINRNKSDELILAVLGDLLGGFIHEELIQNNSCTPMQCVQMLKSCLVSGITHLLEQAPVEKITIIGICGNHSRTTRKKNYSNGFAMSYEYFLYKDVEAYFYGNDKLSFIIPESEMAFVNVMGRNIIFMHGDQVRSQKGGLSSISILTYI